MAMPTDLAFALAILVLASRALPPGVRPFLLTLAIVDDLLTVAVVGLFYAGDLSAGWLLLAALLVGVMIALERAHVQHLLPYVALGVLTWFCAYEGGVHPALVGALLGLLAPAYPFNPPAAVGAAARRIADAHAAGARVARRRCRELAGARAPVERGGLAVGARGARAAAVGEPVRVAAVRACERRRAALRRLVVGPHRTAADPRAPRRPPRSARPSGSSGRGCWPNAGVWPGSPTGMSLGMLVAVGVAAGAPFTVSLFVASGAYPQGSSLLAAARVGVLLSLAVCGVLGAVLFRASPRTRSHRDPQTIARPSVSPSQTAPSPSTRLSPMFANAEPVAPSSNIRIVSSENVENVV